MATKWTTKDTKAAAKQGWNLFDADYIGGTRVAIQRVDDPDAWGSKQPCPRFPDDESAAAYIVGRADMGCPLARKALRLVEPPHNIGSLRDWNKQVA